MAHKLFLNKPLFSVLMPVLVPFSNGSIYIVCSFSFCWRNHYACLSNNFQLSFRVFLPHLIFLFLFRPVLVCSLLSPSGGGYLRQCVYCMCVSVSVHVSLSRITVFSDAAQLLLKLNPLSIHRPLCFIVFLQVSVHMRCMPANVSLRFYYSPIVCLLCNVSPCSRVLYVSVCPF